MKSFIVLCFSIMFMAALFCIGCGDTSSDPPNIEIKVPVNVIGQNGSISDNDVDETGKKEDNDTTQEDNDETRYDENYTTRDGDITQGEECN